MSREPRPTASPAKESRPHMVRPELQLASLSSSLTMTTEWKCSKAVPSTLQALPHPTFILGERASLGAPGLPITFAFPVTLVRGVVCICSLLLLPAHCQ